jgi:hypothetical protein
MDHLWWILKTTRDKSTRTAGLTTAKILINSVISTFGAKFLVIDINFFNLNTPSDDLNTWSSTCHGSLRKRSTNTTCSTYHKTERCTLKFKKECTGSQGWIPTHTTHTRTLDPRHSPYIILASSR